MTFFKSFKNVKGIRDLFQNDKHKGQPIMIWAQEILREKSALSSADRELIAAFTSSLNHCDYCCSSHSAFAESLGIEKKTLDRVISQNYSNMKLAPILDYVLRLTLFPEGLKQSDYDKVIEAGFSEEELHDAILVCSAFNMFNRIVEGHKLSANEDSWLEITERINSIGYDGRYLHGK
jgi:uncharacterized peroxidase-related enzyme